VNAIARYSKETREGSHPNRLDPTLAPLLFTFGFQVIAGWDQGCYERASFAGLNEFEFVPKARGDLPRLAPNLFARQRLTPKRRPSRKADQAGDWHADV